MFTLYDKIIESFNKNPEVIFGFTDIHFSNYYSRYKSALVYAVPHSKMLTPEIYCEQLFDSLIKETRDKGLSIQKEIETILCDGDYKYVTPSPAQTSEDTLIAPFSFKYAAVNAHLGWIGKNDVLITEKYGPRVMLFAILVDYDFPETAPISDSECPEECFLCVAACPHNALKGKQWNIHTKRTEIIDYQLCNQKRKLYIASHDRKHACGFCMVCCPWGL